MAWAMVTGPIRKAEGPGTAQLQGWEGSSGCLGTVSP